VFGRSRRALFEVLVVSDAIRQALRDGQRAGPIRAIASAEGFRSLADEVGRRVGDNALSEAEGARALA